MVVVEIIIGCEGKRVDKSISYRYKLIVVYEILKVVVMYA